MPDFSGISTHVVDEKRRITIPKRFFEHIEKELDQQKKFMLTLGPDGCLLLMPKETWEQAAGARDSSYFTSERERDRRRLMIGFAEDGTPDRAARLFLPEMLREAAEIKSSITGVVLQGIGDVIEIWSPAVWEQRVQKKLLSDPTLFDDDIPATAGPTVSASGP